jgi:uncharacterized iron-regulated membrane protein
MSALEIWIATALGLSVAAFAGAYLWSLRRAGRRSDETLSSEAPRSDRWVVLEIERKQSAEDGLLWEVHDNWEPSQHREVTP